MYSLNGVAKIKEGYVHDIKPINKFELSQMDRIIQGLNAHIVFAEDPSDTVYYFHTDSIDEQSCKSHVSYFVSKGYKVEKVANNSLDNFRRLNTLTYNRCAAVYVFSPQQPLCRDENVHIKWQPKVQSWQTKITQHEVSKLSLMREKIQSPKKPSVIYVDN